MFAAVNVGNMCVGAMTIPEIPFHLGQVAGLLRKEPDDVARLELLGVARKLCDLAPKVEEERIRQWVMVTIDLAQAAATCTNQKKKDHFLMVLRGVEVALEQNPPVRGLGKQKNE